MVFVSSVPPFLSTPTPGSVKEIVKYMKRAGVRDYPSLLALVCRRWRYVSRTSQALHAFLFVDVEDAYDFKQTDEYYAAFLARSGSRPLTLSVNGMQDTTLDLLAAAPFRDHLPRLRWACIDLYVSELLGNYDDPTGFDVFPLFPGVQTPLLETVHVDVGQDGSLATDDGATEYFNRYSYRKVARGNQKILRHAPRLRSFSMYRYDPKGLSPMLLQNVGLDYQTLTCLRLPYVALCAAEWLKVLAELPVLRVFHGSLPRDDSDEENSSSDEEPDEEVDVDTDVERVRGCPGALSSEALLLFVHGLRGESCCMNGAYTSEPRSANVTGLGGGEELLLLSLMRCGRMRVSL